MNFVKVMEVLAQIEELYPDPAIAIRQIQTSHGHKFEDRISKSDRDASFTDLGLIINSYYKENPMPGFDLTVNTRDHSEIMRRAMEAASKLREYIPVLKERLEQERVEKLKSKPLGQLTYNELVDLSRQAEVKAFIKAILT